MEEPESDIDSEPDVPFNNLQIYRDMNPNLRLYRDPDAIPGPALMRYSRIGHKPSAAPLRRPYCMQEEGVSRERGPERQVSRALSPSPPPPSSPPPPPPPLPVPAPRQRGPPRQRDNQFQEADLEQIEEMFEMKERMDVDECLPRVEWALEREERAGALSPEWRLEEDGCSMQRQVQVVRVEVHARAGGEHEAKADSAPPAAPLKRLYGFDSPKVSYLRFLHPLIARIYCCDVSSTIQVRKVCVCTFQTINTINFFSHTP